MPSAQPMPNNTSISPSEDNAIDESALVKQAIIEQRTGRKNEAFAVLYTQHVNRVYGYLLTRVANVADAQDLTAQTFLVALQKISQYRGDGSFGAWLLGIARHKLIDQYRKKRPIVSLDQLDNLMPNAPSLDDVVGRQLRIEQVILALQSITPDRAEALVLNIFGGLKLAEVGQVMGKSEAAAKMLVHRAIKDLRTRLRHVDEE